MSAVRLTTSLSPRVFFSMEFSSAPSWVDGRRVRLRTHLRRRDGTGRIQSSRLNERTGEAIASLVAIDRFSPSVGAQCWGNARSLRKRRACIESNRKDRVHEKSHGFLEVL